MPRIPGVASPVQSRREGSAVTLRLEQPRDATRLLCDKGTLLAQAPLAVHQDPQGLFVQSCFPAAFLQPASADAWVCSSLGAALSTHLC